MKLKCKNNHVFTDEVIDRFGRPLPKLSNIDLCSICGEPLEEMEVEKNVNNIDKFFSQTVRDVRNRIKDSFKYRLLVEYSNFWPLSPPYFSITEIVTKKLLRIFPFQQKKKVFILYSKFFNNVDSGKMMICYIIYDEKIKHITNEEIEKLAKKFTVDTYGFIMLQDSLVRQIIKKIRHIPNVKRIEV